MSERQTVNVGGRTIGLTSLDRVMYPATGMTKADVLEYVVAVAPKLHTQLADRPITRKRWPHGVGREFFFEKNVPKGAPPWVKTVTLTGSDQVTYPLISADEDPLPTLVWLVQLGSLELHTPQWRIEGGKPTAPDRLVIDLDPGPGVGLAECAQVSELVIPVLTQAGLTQPQAVLSGSKGMQLYADLPVDGAILQHGVTADVVSQFVKTLAQHLSQANPELVEWRMAKELRPGKVFLDWSQNAGAKTTITPWSLRGTEQPHVAVPVPYTRLKESAAGANPLVQLSPDQVLRAAD